MSATTPTTKLSKTVFMFHLFGLKRNIIYNCRTKEIFMADDAGVKLYTISADEELEFEDFDLVARNMFLDVLEAVS